MLKRYKILTLKKIHPPVWQMRRVKIVKRVGLTIVVLLLPMPCRLVLVRADRISLDLSKMKITCSLLVKSCRRVSSGVCRQLVLVIVVVVPW